MNPGIRGGGGALHQCPDRPSGSPSDQEAAITIATSTHAPPAGRHDVAGAPRAQLLAQRRAHLQALERLRVAAGELLDGAHLLDLPGDDGFGEGDGASVERDRVRAMAAATRRNLDDVDDALARLDAGRYGICQGCGDPIPPARLEALPEATHCVACKSGGLRRR